jgi:DNA-directed RNA polymerase subunit RPC12/RpoP
MTEPTGNADPEEVRCPCCNGRRIEMWMRAVVYPDDPMKCGDCGREFVAAECPNLKWRPSVA